MSSDNVVSFDIDDLTVGEIEEVEELSGSSIDALGTPGEKKGKLLRAIGMVKKKRTDPNFTWEQARDLRAVQVSDDVPPTDAAG